MVPHLMFHELLLPLSASEHYKFGGIQIMLN